MREKDMGSPGSGAADCTVGSIVWVRRRNGSWWPGKILGQEDLDSTHITSPRSGTPVKLLGREDASVDWYNLEKSKRVKPFRCGDFDECIERVESTQGLTIRKREKYARREDAILHALELEKEMMKKEGKLLLVPEKANGTRESLGLNHVVGDDDVVVMHLVKDKEEEDQPSCDDEAVPRMRGLQDFGLKTASSKRKFSSFNGLDNASFKSLARSNSPASSSGDHSMDRPIYTLGKENARSTMEAKRTKYMFTPNETNDVLDLHESLLSHRDAMRTSSTFPADSRYSLPGYDPPEFLEDVETDSEESETETSDMEEDTDDDIPLVSGSARHSEQQRNTFSRHMSGDDESTSSEDEEEDLYDSSMSGDSSYLNETGTVSKWQLKGKRNMRNLPRRSTRKREMHRSSSNRLEDGRYCEYKRRGFNQLGFSDDGTDDDTDPRLGDDDDDYRIPNMITSGCNNNNKNIFSHEMLDWDDDPWEGRIGKKRSEEEKIVDRKTYSPLMDVELEVRGSYTKGPVPIVSLMSKLNGRAIIGHPVEIEILPDGSSDSFDYFGGNETTYHDKPFLLPPAWKTARRSNSRVPRLHPFSSSVDGEDDDHHHHSPVRKKKLGIGNLMRIPRPPGDRKHYPQHQHHHHHQQLIPPQQQKKFVKNANTSASQKTRALSSFSSEQGGGHQNSGMKALNREQLSNNNSRSVVLPGPPTVACIPVKLVFSRLLEKINRPASVKGFNERRRDLHQ